MWLDAGKKDDMTSTPGKKITANLPEDLNFCGDLGSRRTWTETLSIVSIVLKRPIKLILKSKK